MPQSTSAGSDDSAAGFSFPAVARKRITAAFDGGRLTSDGGVLLLAQAKRVRVSAELVAIKGGLVRWPDSFDRGLNDVFAVQTEIAETIALSLGAEVVDKDEARRSLAAQRTVGGTENVA